MRLVEYRILMPLTLDENYIAQLWSMAEVSRLNTGGGEGVEILKNELFVYPVNTLPNALCNYLPDYDQESNEEKHKKLHSSKSLGAIKNLFKRNSSYDNLKLNGATNELPKDQQKNETSHNHKMLSKHESINVENGNSDMYRSVPDSLSGADNNNNTNQQGQYTYKIYRLESKLPWFVRKLLPKGSTVLHEKSWNMYPVIKTHLKNEYMKEKFHIRIDTVTRECVNGQFDENIHGLSEEQLEKREIIIVNIADDVSTTEYVENEDPAKFKSKKTGRGPLTEKDWYKTQQPLICCYKLVDVEFIWLGLQTKAENYMINMYAKLFKKFHRQIFCWMDKWHGLTLDDVRKYELELQNKLSEQINHGELAPDQLGDLAE